MYLPKMEKPFLEEQFNNSLSGCHFQKEPQWRILQFYVCKLYAEMKKATYILFVSDSFSAPLNAQSCNWMTSFFVGERLRYQVIIKLTYQLYLISGEVLMKVINQNRRKGDRGFALSTGNEEFGFPGLIDYICINNQ